MIRLTLICVLFAARLGAVVINVPGDYPTIGEGIAAAVSGDIVLVAAGHYVEEINLKAGVIVQGAGEGLSIIDGGGDAGDVVRAIGNSIRSDTKFQGFTVTGAISGGGMPGGAGIFCNSGAAPDISNNRLEGNDFGIALWNGSNPVVHNNVIVYNTFFAVELSSAASIINNTIGYCRIGIDDGGGYGPVVMNNIITGCTRFGVYAVGTQPQLTYNDVWGNDTNYRNCSPGTGSDSLDPVFRDTLAGDYHLAPGSPCINAGNPAPQYNDPDGTRNDIGAYGGPGAVVNRPRVTFLSPARNALNAVDSARLSVGFNVAMDPAGFTPAGFRHAGHLGRPGHYVVGYDSAARMASLVADDRRLPGEVVTATLTRAIQAASGESLGGFTWQFTTAVTAGSGRFDRAERYFDRRHCNAVAFGDFDRDGDPDLVLAGTACDSVIVMDNQDQGRYVRLGGYQTGSGPVAVSAGNCNNDTFLDLAVANTGSNNFSILLGQGSGSFAPAQNFATTDAPQGILFGDFNADGNLDAALAAGTGYAAVHLGDGAGGFGPVRTFTVGADPVGIVTGDFNSDGRLDLALANRGSNNVSVLLGDGNGGFGSATNFTAGTAPQALRTGDFNADGNLDLAVANSGTNTVSVLAGTGTGSFGPAANHTVGSTPVDLAIGDLNGDGALDIMTVSRGDGRRAVLTGNGRGGFGPAESDTMSREARALAVADVDADGDLDAAVGVTDSCDLYLLFNSAALLVTATRPDAEEAGVPLSSDLAADFNQPADFASLNDTTWLVAGGWSGPVAGVITGDSMHPGFAPGREFSAGEPLTATLTRAVRTPGGIALGGHAWSFRADVPTASSGTFAGPQAFSAGPNSRGMVAADFDRDGAVDLATAVSTGAVQVLLNDGNGAFPDLVTYITGQEPIAIFGADLDADGDIDLAVYSNQPGSSHLTLMTNDGDGTFTVGASSAPAILGEDIAGGDLDGDGDVDLVLTDGWGSSNNVRILFNTGNGAFLPPVNYSAGSGARGCAVHDVDNDGRLDLVVANGMNDNISVFRNRGDGTFPTSATYATGSGVNAILVDDVNGDRHADIVTADYGSGSVGVLLNQGNGSFAPVAEYPAGAGARYLVAGDFDGDDDLDIAVSRDMADSLAVVLNDGTGAFGPPAGYAVGDFPWGVQTADFDLDGDLDLAAASYGSADIRVWYNTGVAGVGSGHTGVRRPALTVGPNPFRDRLLIHLAPGARSGPTEVTISDITGRRVRRLALPRTATTLSWDAGSTIAPGIYFVSVAGAPPVKVIRTPETNR